MEMTRFTDILKSDSGLYGAVSYNYSLFSKILEDNSCIFFREYTDHGVKHVSQVIESGENLCTRSVFDVATPNDAAVFVLSSLFHDMAMHIGKCGFVQLVNDCFDVSRYEALGDERWSALWCKYLSEINRWHDDKMLSVFGVNGSVRFTGLYADCWTDSDYRIVGEFIRKYHHVMAHHFCVFGFPGKEKLIRVVNIDDDLLDLVGLACRCHRMKARDCYDYLIERHGTYRLPCDVHFVFIACLLRLSDTLQIQSKRASQVVFDAKGVSNEKSVKEWRRHWAIRNVQTATEDIEMLWVDARPNTNKEFLDIVNLIDDVQAVLDECWAAVGEVYSRFTKEKMHLLAFTVRRVLSNVCNVRAYSKSVKYVPGNIRLSVDQHNLLQLLVGPLYGNDITYGIRELISNSVDAVNELSCIDQVCSSDISLFIKLTHKNDRYMFEIEDFGIGMNLDIIRDYFLRAGASYRYCQGWRDNFVDENGVNKIHRIGKFGIGVVASFLLGSNIHVVTRRHGESVGYEFDVEFTSNPVEVIKTHFHVGTKITIEISESDFWRLANNIKDWIWCYSSFPKIVREITFDSREVAKRSQTQIQRGATSSCSVIFDGDTTFIVDIRDYLDHIPGSVGGGWFRSYVDLDCDVASNYMRHGRLRGDSKARAFSPGPDFYVNGIFVSRDEVLSVDGRFFSDGYVELLHPSISVFDFNGVVPLDVHRKSVTDVLYFADHLLKSALVNFCIFLGFALPQNDLLDVAKIDGLAFKYCGYNPDGGCGVYPWIATHDGYKALGSSLPVNSDGFMYVCYSLSNTYQQLLMHEVFPYGILNGKVHYTDNGGIDFKPFLKAIESFSTINCFCALHEPRLYFDLYRTHTDGIKVRDDSFNYKYNYVKSTSNYLLCYDSADMADGDLVNIASKYGMDFIAKVTPYHSPSCTLMQEVWGEIYPNGICKYDFTERKFDTNNPLSNDIVSFYRVTMR